MLDNFAPFDERDVSKGLVIGVFFALSAFALASQTFQSYKSGFMYCGRNEKVYRKDDPRRFKVWFGVQIFFAAFLAVMAIYALAA